MIEILSKYRIILFCILGSFVRLIYGYIYEPWTEAPDHLAWELILEQGSFKYDHLIHYPHEGGTILITLLSQIVELFTNFSSLTVSAFLIDFAVRFFQIKIVSKVFNLQIATLFGVWTIFSTPSILPYGTVNFALHSISSLFPFLLLLLLFQHKDTVKYHLFCGVFLGLALWFSYSNMVLIPAFFLYRIITREKCSHWMYSVLSLSAVVAIHGFVRIYTDAGFHLREFGLMAIRSADFSIYDIDFIDRILKLPIVIANGATALPGANSNMVVIQIIYIVVAFLSVIGFVFTHKKSDFRTTVYMIFPTIVLFLISYLFSPFYEMKVMGNYITFRHLTYIIPFVSLFIIVGLSSLKYKHVLILFLVLGIVRSGQLFTAEKSPPNDMFTQASGWILGTKLGHDPTAVSAIIDDNVDKKELLIKGVGWGISTSLMDNNKGGITERIDQLVNLYFTYPVDYQEGLLEGIKFSFSDQVTPKLNPDLLMKIERRINKRKISLDVFCSTKYTVFLAAYES